MRNYSGKSRIFIFLGDLALFYVALFAALFIRYNVNLNKSIVEDHILPFSILFVLWLLVFIIGGLYEKHVRVLKNRLPGTIFRVQIANSIIAIAFFYAVPYFGIAPKITLFIYLVVSFILIMVWRIYGPLLLGQKAQEAIFLGRGLEMDELVYELSHHTGYPIVPVATIEPSALLATIKSHPNAEVIVADIGDSELGGILPRIYGLVAGGYEYIEIHRLYEDVFKRLPVSLLDERWLIENVSLMPRGAYDALKRSVDVVCGGVLFIVSLPFYVLAYVLIKLDDGGPLFFIHERVGQNGKGIKVVKFRSMQVHSEKDGLAKEKNITRIGAFLRKSRIDELPQLWNVVKGDLSLVGPRPELPTLVRVYDTQIPYYSLRHIVKPGLSGWAQINQKTPPKFMAEVDATKQKVAYDLFYIKHRSLVLDIVISLQTIRELLSRRGV